MSGKNDRYLLLFNGAVLLICAVSDFALRDTLLIGFMLFLPFLDRHWKVPRLRSYRHQRAFWLVLTGSVFLIALGNPRDLDFILYTILLVALPEEWFFRAYFMRRLELFFGDRWLANIATSMLFAVLHVPSQGWNGLTVIVPSLILGWIYQQQRDFVLVVLLHALSNLVYLLYLSDVLVYSNAQY